jgi:hypothetical protein
MSSRLSFRPSRGDNVTVDQTVNNLRDGNKHLKPAPPIDAEVRSSGLGHQGRIFRSNARSLGG